MVALAAWSTWTATEETMGRENESRQGAGWQYLKNMLQSTLQLGENPEPHTETVFEFSLSILWQVQRTIVPIKSFYT
jgi:hypothetical protein